MMSTEKYTSMRLAVTLANEFGRRFVDFRKLSVEFDILSSLFTTDFKKESDAPQLELIYLQCDFTLKQKFQSESKDKFYPLLNASKFANLRKMAVNITRSVWVHTLYTFVNKHFRPWTLTRPSYVPI